MKKVILSFLAITIIFLSVITPNNKASAALPVLTRVVGGSVGERVIIGVGEKVGVKFTSKKAAQEAVERWNLDIYEKIVEAEKYGRTHEAEQLKQWRTIINQQEVDGLTVVEGGKNAGKGFGQLVVDSAMFLVGIDILLDTVDEIKGAVANQKLIEKVEEYTTAIEDGKAYTTVGPYSFYIDGVFTGDKKQSVAFGNENASDVLNIAGAASQIAYTAIGDAYMAVITEVTGSASNVYHYEITYTNTSKKTVTEQGSVELLSLPNLKQKLALKGSVEEIPDYNKVNWQPLTDNIPSSPSLPWVTPWRSDPDTNKPILPDTVPIEVPLQDPDIYNPGEPWNEPLPEYEPNPDYVPGDQPDKDYIPGIPVNPTPTPGTDSPTVPDPGGNTNPNPESPTVPEPGGNTEPVSPTTPGTPGTPTPDPPGNGKDGPVKTDPLSWIWIFIKFLIAIIMFLLRLAKFIITIPLVPAEQFPGVYGEMVATFMNLKYGNIYPYKIMISIVNLAFGFVVYKMLRRVFNG